MKRWLTLTTSIETSIIIKASSDKVWNILTNFQRHQEWNPFISSIDHLSRADYSSTIINTPGSPFTLKPSILELRWSGKVFRRGIFDREYYFRVEALNATEVVCFHGEEFSGFLVKWGLLVKLIPDMIARTRLCFEAMNWALKVRAESQS